MKVGIIGTGNMASGLANVLASVKHDVVIGSRDPGKAAALAEKIGRGVQGGGIAAAVRLADVIFVATPFAGASDVLREAGDLTGKILVDITNPITPDFKSLAIGHTTSAAEEIQALAPRASVVKAFNTIFAPLLAVEARQAKQMQVFVASDDAAAKAQVSSLAQSIGFEAIDAGPLSNSRFIEPIGEMNIHFAFFLGKGPVVAPAWIQV